MTENSGLEISIKMGIAYSYIVWRDTLEQDA